MKNLFYFFVCIFLLQNTAFASAYNDYQEMQARNALRNKYYTCMAYADAYTRGIRISTNTRYCYELGPQACQEAEQKYKSIIKKCEEQYGKYK